MINLVHHSTKSLPKKTIKFSLRTYATESLAAKYSKHGNPTNVIKIEKVSLPNAQNGQVLVKMLKAPINPSDLSVVEGTHTNFPENSYIGGEGVGEVIQVGGNVKDLKVGDYVVPSNSNIGTWRTHLAEDQTQFIPIREKGLALEYLACLSINPMAAYRILEDFVKLNKGDVIIQNGANSMIGKCVIQLAKLRGIKTVNLIRQNDNDDHNISKIKSYGGDVIDTYENLASYSFKKKLNDLPKPKLAINYIGGGNVADMARLLEDGATVVTAGSMSRDPMTIPTSLMMFKDIRLKGFSLDEWNSSAELTERRAMYNKVLGMIKDNTLKFDIETFDFEKDLAKAISRSKESQSIKCVLNFGK